MILLILAIDSGFNALIEPEPDIATEVEIFILLL